jgi:hypothetical protein
MARDYNYVRRYKLGQNYYLLHVQRARQGRERTRQSMVRRWQRGEENSNGDDRDDARMRDRGRGVVIHVSRRLGRGRGGHGIPNASSPATAKIP